MSKTFLELTNQVGRNMRRSGGNVAAYAAVDVNSDQVVIQQAINDIKRDVEDSWKWNILRKTVTFASVALTGTYDTSSLAIVTSDPVVTTDRSFLLTDNRGRPMFFDVTTSLQGFRLAQRTRDGLTSMRRQGTVGTPIPGDFAVYPSGNGLTIEFLNTPSSIRNYSGEFYIPQDDLAIATDPMYVPWRPVVLGATAMAMEERGEEFGEAAQRYWDRYDEALAESIAKDMEATDAVMYST